MEFEVTDSGLSFKGLEVGTIQDGKVQFDFDELRQIVIRSSRFASGRKIENRTLNELVNDINVFIKDLNQAGTKSSRDINNLEVMLAASQDYIQRQNIEINELKKALNEANRAVQKS